MDMKIKENVNFNSFTFRKRVIEESLDLIGKKRNYIINDIYFITMIAMVNNIVEDDMIIELLYNEEELENKIYEIVEPIFNSNIMSNEDGKKAFTEISEDIIDYIDRDVYSRTNVVGFLYDIFEGLGDIDVAQLKEGIAKASEFAKNELERASKNAESIGKPKDKDIMKEALDDIENAKMKALIESFTRKEGIDTTKENAAE